MEISPKNISISKGKIKVKTNRRGMIVLAMSWCPYCQANKPVYLQVAQMMSNDLNMFYIEGDASQANGKLFDRLNSKGLIKGYPTILFFNDKGEVIGEFNGERSVKGYLDAICKKLSKC